MNSYSFVTGGSAITAHQNKSSKEIRGIVISFEEFLTHWKIEWCQKEKHQHVMYIPLSQWTKKVQRNTLVFQKKDAFMRNQEEFTMFTIHTSSNKE